MTLNTYFHCRYMHIYKYTYLLCEEIELKTGFSLKPLHKLFVFLLSW